MLSMLWMGLAACNGGGDPQDTGTPPVPDLLDPAQACVDYLACLEAVGSAELELAGQVYGPEGSCWVDATEALSCAQTCDAALLTELVSEPTTLACWGDGVPPTEALFTEIGTEFPIGDTDGDERCDAFSTWGLTVTGTGDESFEATLQGEIDNVPYTFTQSCSLLPEAAFTCGPLDAFLGWSGTFSADWTTAALHAEYDNGFTAFDCDLTVNLLGTPRPPLPEPDPELIVPIAVGFEVRAGIPDGSALDAWGYDGGSYVPYLELTFSDARYFITGDSAYTCSAIAFFGNEVAYGGITQRAPSNPIPVGDGAELYASYEDYIDLQTATTSTDCDDLVDESIWGTNATGLLAPFDGAHVGIGFGPITDYLLEQWQYAELDAQTTDALMSMYVAINDANGNWIGHGWSSAIVWAVDPATGDIIVDADGFAAIPVDASGLSPGDDLPVGVMLSYPSWSQDFFLLDLGNLGDPP